MEQINPNDSFQARHLYARCPLCGSSDFGHIGHANCKSHPLYHHTLPEIINWQTCNICSHIFTDGYFTEEALQILFSKSNRYQLPDIGTFEHNRVISAKIIDKISRFLPGQEGKWLDVGFGNGSLMTTAEEYGFEAMGIDLRSDAVQAMREYGCDARCVEFTQVTGHEIFTVISMADVLEHMPDPRQALMHAFDLLVPGGLLFVSCPNADSFLWRMLHLENKNPYWSEIEHYHNFGRKRLSSLLDEVGFVPVHYGISERYRICMEVIASKK